MNPTKKAPAIEALIDKLGNFPRRKSIQTNTCALCGKIVKGFKDQLSLKEYTISGLCQECQDDIF